MEEELLQAARESLEREGLTDIDADFDLSTVDQLTRWVAAGAIEKTVQMRFKDADIEAAATLADLVALALPTS